MNIEDYGKWTQTIDNDFQREWHKGHQDFLWALGSKIVGYAFFNNGEEIDRFYDFYSEADYIKPIYFSKLK